MARSLLSALSGAGVVGAGCGPENGDGGQLLVVREGGRVYEDAGLWRLMADDPLPSRRQRFAAGCQASLNNKSDVSLNASVVVSTNRRLLRAAELVDTGRADAVLASTVESLWLSGEVPLAELDVSTVRSLTDADDAVIEDYLERVAAPPPARYARSMMAVAYSSSTAEQIVTVVPVIVEDGFVSVGEPGFDGDPVRPGDRRDVGAEGARHRVPGPRRRRSGRGGRRTVLSPLRRVSHSDPVRQLRRSARQRPRTGLCTPAQISGLSNGVDTVDSPEAVG